MVDNILGHGGLFRPMIWLLTGIILSTWALLSVLGGERQRRLAESAQAVPPEPQAPSA